MVGIEGRADEIGRRLDRKAEEGGISIASRGRTEGRKKNERVKTPFGYLDEEGMERSVSRGLQELGNGRTVLDSTT